MHYEFNLVWPRGALACPLRPIGESELVPDGHSRTAKMATDLQRTGQRGMTGQFPS